MSSNTEDIAQIVQRVMAERNKASSVEDVPTLAARVGGPAESNGSSTDGQGVEERKGGEALVQDTAPSNTQSSHTKRPTDKQLSDADAEDSTSQKEANEDNNEEQTDEDEQEEQPKVSSRELLDAYMRDHLYDSNGRLDKKRVLAALTEMYDNIETHSKEKEELEAQILQEQKSRLIDLAEQLEWEDREEDLKFLKSIPREALPYVSDLMKRLRNTNAGNDSSGSLARIQRPPGVAKTDSIVDSIKTSSKGVRYPASGKAATKQITLPSSKPGKRKRTDEAYEETYERAGVPSEDREMVMDVVRQLSRSKNRQTRLGRRYD